MSVILAAMSGGVDSSVAAKRLVDQGHEVHGLFMSQRSAEPISQSAVGLNRSGLASREESFGDNEHESFAKPQTPSPKPSRAAAWTPPRRARGCCSATDAADARRVAAKLGISFHALDLGEEFARLIEHFKNEYRAARTPNPCVLCNQDLKFGRLLEFADRLGADAVATGHYARLGVDDRGLTVLRRALDAEKDQSYYLFSLSNEQLARARFPLGELRKEEVRALARQAGLLTADKPDSQDVCFVPENDYRVLFAGETLHPGRFVDESGRELGRHEGFERFTVGQRRGLGLALGTPHYVVAIDASSAEVVLGTRQRLDADGLIARHATLSGMEEPNEGTRFEAGLQIRASAPSVKAAITWLGRGRFEARFHKAQSAVTPGQAAVLSRGDLILGGGWIEASIPRPSTIEKQEATQQLSTDVQNDV